MGAGVNGQPKAKILVPMEEENPLALVGSSNWDVLGAIQSDIMMEELDFMDRTHCSNMLPSALENSIGALGSTNMCSPLVADDLFAPRSGYEISNMEQAVCARPLDHRALYKVAGVASASPFGLGSSRKASRHSNIEKINAQPNSPSGGGNWAIIQREPSCKELVPSYSEYNFTHSHPYAESMPPSISNVMEDEDDASIHTLDHYILSEPDKDATNTDVDLLLYGGHAHHLGGQYTEVEEVIDDGVQLEEIPAEFHSSDFMSEQ